MLDNLRLDVVEVAVDLQSLLAASFGTIALHVPHVKWNAVLATELALGAIDCHSSHHWNNTLFHLAFVHVEQDFECSFSKGYRFWKNEAAKTENG